MIADIEFRWVKRFSEPHEYSIGSPGCETVLQFRKQIPSIPFCLAGHKDRWEEFSWTDWQDVPVVEE
jgi:hypothetical protein